MPEVSWVWKWIGRPISLLERLDQDAGGRGLEQPGHVLDAQDVAAGGLQLLGEADIVAERILGAVGVEDVAGVADRTLGELAGLAHGVDRDPHVLDPVQAVEDAEQVHAGIGRLLDEVADDIVGVVGVADAVGAAQQHLQQQVGHALAQERQPLPRVLGEEAHGDVEGGAAPALQRQELRQAAGVGVGAGDQVVGAHAGGEQRLRRVAHGGVGDQHAGLLAHPGGEALRARAGRAAAWCRCAGVERRPRTAAARAAGRRRAAGRGRSTSGWPLTVTSPM